MCVWGGGGGGGVEDEERVQRKNKQLMDEGGLNKVKNQEERHFVCTHEIKITSLIKNYQKLSALIGSVYTGS